LRGHRLREFEKKMLRRKYVPKREEAAEDLKRLHNEKLHILYASPNIIRMIKSRKIKLAGHIARMKENRNA